MADNQYGRYLDNNQQQRQGVSLSGMAMLGAGAFGAALGLSPRLRNETMGAIQGGVSAGIHGSLRIASYLNKAGRVTERTGSVMNFLHAADAAMDKRSLFQRAMTPGVGGFSKEVFESRYRQGLGEIGRPMAYKIENSFSQATYDKVGLSTEYFSSVRRQLAINDLKRKMPQHFQNGLEEILADKHSSFFNDPSDGKILGLLHEYGKDSPGLNTKSAFQIDLPDHTAKQDFMNQMLSSLQKFKDFDTHNIRAGGSIEGMQVQGAKALTNTLEEGFLRDNQAKTSWVNTVLGNVRHKSVRDIAVRNTAGDFVLDPRMDPGAIIRLHRTVKKGVSAPFNEGTEYHAESLRKLVTLANEDSRYLDLALDPMVFMTQAGETIDLRQVGRGLTGAASLIQKSLQVPFLRFNPLDLIHWSSIQSVMQAAPTQLLRRGTIEAALQGSVQTLRHPHAHNQDAAAGTLARDYVYANGKVFDLISGEMAKDDVYLTSRRFGMIPRTMASMANLHRVDTHNRGLLSSIYDIGAQESESMWSRMASMYTKFKDPDWARNRLRAVTHVDTRTPEGLESLEASYKDIYAELHTHATSLSDRTANYINEHVKQAYGASNIDLMAMTTDKDAMATLGRISMGIREGNQRLVGDRRLGGQIGQAWKRYGRNPDQYVENARVVTDHAPVLPGPMAVIDSHNAELITKVEDARRLVHQHAIQQLEERAGVTVSDLVKQGIQDGKLDPTALHEVQDLDLLSRMHEYWDDIYLGHPSDKAQALKDFRGDYLTNSEFKSNLDETIDRYTPLWASGPGDKPPQYFGNGNYMVMNKAKGYKWALQNFNEQIQQGVNPLNAGVKSALSVLGQPFAGRKNLGDVTTATLPFYNLIERMDNTLAKVGIGLSQKNRGSMQSIFMNQFMRRVVLPYAAYEQFNYFSDMTGLKDKMADTYANMSLDAAWVKDMLGLNSIGKEFSSVFQGTDQLWRTPVGGLLKHASFGILGDSRSEDELRKYYESGEDPIRRGRWWGIGSTTPWEGGKIDHFEPNWYRREKSHYKYTDSMYGSADEYWANNWMPTLTHPFAPISHFLTDPNHWANKHKVDRPYPITGGIGELEGIPFIGSLLNGTIGQVLNPTQVHPNLQKAHERYLEEVNAYTKAKYENSVGGGNIQFLPAGGYRMFSDATGFGGGLSLGVGPDGLTGSGSGNGSGGGDGTGTGDGSGGSGGAGGDGTGSGGSGGYLAEDGTIVGGGGFANMTDLTRAELASFNINTTGGFLGVPSRSVTELSALRDPDFMANLKDISNPYSGGNTVSDTWYSLTEMGGIYGFSANMLSGIDTNKRSMALDRSYRMMSYSRQFWDMNLGGGDLFFGGELSEIFRRYVARDPRKQNYNPLRNTMPDWIPGVDYFTDFQHGDPYTKVPKGEMRLPGSGYEKLNQLHPDQFGEYGAFDRFKILADVAPYSDEFRMWKKIVSGMNANSLLTPRMQDEAGEIRDQVAARKSKYHFYPKRFHNAEIKKESVTITRVLDANTFMTKEHPNNPIRLAGVEIPAGATEVQDWLKQYIYEGANVTIGLDGDPLFRVAADTMQTMHAVVYSNGSSEDSWYASSRGQSINSMLARKKFGGTMGMIGGSNPVRLKDDGSAVATAALFDPAQITVGKMWETLSHDILPNIPIAGIVIDKFMQVRTPLEMYKKNELYGKAWKPWYDPWGGWIQPMLDRATSVNPLLATAQGYGIGWLFGKSKSAKFYGSRIGAAVFGTLSALRATDEFIGERMPGGKNYAWIPERRKKERGINEYFDIIKYMKYQGLYSRAKVEALNAEGVDIDKLIGKQEALGEKHKSERRVLETSKKWLSMSKDLGYVGDDQINEYLDKVRGRMTQISQYRATQRIGPQTMQALQYKDEYESTLYGADPNGDMQKIFKALPNKDKEFFQQFMTASPTEREEILRLVPKDQRRFYEAKWGMNIEDKQSLASYFTNHYLPGANWEGWNPDVSLDDIKYKVVRHEGIEATEFNMWDDQAKRSNNSDVDRIDPFKPSMLLDVARIQRVLEGAGLRDVNVTMATSPSNEHKMNVGMNILQDRMQDIKDGLRDNIGALFG